MFKQLWKKVLGFFGKKKVEIPEEIVISAMPLRLEEKKVFIMRQSAEDISYKIID